MAHKKSNAGKMGLAAVGAAAAAAGAYYLYGSKNAAKNRKTASKLIKKAETSIKKGTKQGIKIAKSKIGPKISETIDREMMNVKKAIKDIQQ